MKTRRILLGAIAALVVLGAVAGCQSEPEPIKIGVIEEFQIEKETRQETVKGMSLFVDEINQRGGVNGRNIELIVAEYEPADEEHALLALEEIEQTHHPLAYISVGSDVPELTAAFAEEHEVVYFTLTSARDVTEGREWAFKYGVDLQSYFRLAAIMINRLDIQNWSFLYNRDLFFGSLFPTITGEMLGKPTLNIEVESFGDNDTDYREQIRALSDNEAIYFYTTISSQALNMMRQIRELDYQGHVFSVEVYADPFSTEIPEFEGVYSSATIVHKPDFLFAEDLRERFDEVYGTSVFSFFNEHAAQGYDIIRLISELVEDEEPTRETLKNLLDQGFSYDGIFGNLNLLPGEHFIEIAFYLVQYGNGTLEYLQ